MKKLALILSLLVLASFMGCLGGDDDGPTGTGTALTTEEADSISSYWFGAMLDSLENFEDVEDLGDMDSDAMQAGFQEVLDSDPDHSLANLGMAAVLTVEMGADPTIWNAIDSLFEQTGTRRAVRAESPLGRLLLQQFRLITEAPLLMTAATREFPVSLTLPMLQRYIYVNMLPKVDRILAHIEIVEGNSLFAIPLELAEESYEIDLGEIYVLDAVVRGLRAGLRLTLPYDLDIAHPELDYEWLLMLDDDVHFDYELVEGPPEAGDSLFIHHEETAQSAVLMLEMLEYQLAPGSDFLTLHSSGGGWPYGGAAQLDAAQDDLLGMLGKLETAYDLIMAETDDQDDDIIKIDFLDALDVEIAECMDCPEDWQGILDVTAWVEQLLTEPYDIDLGEGGMLTIDLAAFFEGAVPDWKALLPYHEFADEAEWVSASTDEYWWTPSNGEVWVWDNENEEQLYFTDIDYVGEYHYYESVDDPLHLLDGPTGDPIDPGEVMPYLPDYTFGGIFPGMTRVGWEELLGYGPVK